MLNVIIPAAGIGTRLRPHTHTMPKSMLHVAGKPMIGHILDGIGGLPDLGEIALVVGFRGDLIREYVSNEYDLPVRFIEQHSLRGLGYAVNVGLSELDDSPALTVLGDTILEIDYTSFMAAGPNVLGVKEVADPRRFGVAEVTGDRITHLVEKPANPPSNLAVVGLYYISDVAVLRDCLKTVIESDQTVNDEFQMTDALQMMIERGVDMRVAMVEGWFDCGKLETLLETNRHLLDRQPTSAAADNSVIVPPVHVADGARVRHSVIGPHVSIAAGARIDHSIIENAIICERAHISHACLTETMVSADATVAGTPKRLSVGDHAVVAVD